MTTLSRNIPLSPLSKSMECIRAFTSPYIIATKNSHRVPDVIKCHIDTPCKFVTKYINPILVQCDETLNQIIPNLNEKIDTIINTMNPPVVVHTDFESYPDDVLKATDSYTKIVFKNMDSNKVDSSSNATHSDNEFDMCSVTSN